jgi:hypothetical protein
MKYLLSAILALSVAFTVAPVTQEVPTVATTNLLYGPILQKHFPKTIPIHGWDYPIGELPCHTTDITHFDVTATTTRAYGPPALQVSGSLTLGNIISPYEVIEGAQGKKYMLHLQAYLFSPSGRIVWQQQGFPAGNSWVNAEGGKVNFTLINSYTGSTVGYELFVLAAGDPIFSSNSETRVLLGAIRITLQ